MHNEKDYDVWHENKAVVEKIEGEIEALRLKLEAAEVSYACAVEIGPL